MSWCSSRRSNVTPDYLAGFDRIGYRHLSVDQLVQLKAMDITPEFVRPSPAQAADADIDQAYRAEDVRHASTKRRLGGSSAPDAFPTNRLSIGRTRLARQGRLALGYPCSSKGELRAGIVHSRERPLLCSCAARPRSPGRPAPLQSAASRTTIYEAAFFAQYAPRTAYDIVQHVPGFQLDLGSTQSVNGSVDVRGFAGTAGNVVINGSRPSTKSETLDTTLEADPGPTRGSRRARSRRPLRLRLCGQEPGPQHRPVRCSRLRRERHGARDPALHRLRPAKSLGLRPHPQGPVDHQSFRRDRRTTSNSRKAPTRSTTPRQATSSSSGASTTSITTGIRSFGRLRARARPGRRVPHQCRAGSQAASTFTSAIASLRRTALRTTTIYTRTIDDPVFELGGDVTRPLAEGAIKFVALATRRKRDDVDRSVERNGLIEDGATVIGGFEQTIDARRNETIGRLSWTRSRPARLLVRSRRRGRLQHARRPHDLVRDR